MAARAGARQRAQVQTLAAVWYVAQQPAGAQVRPYRQLPAPARQRLQARVVRLLADTREAVLPADEVVLVTATHLGLRPFALRVDRQFMPRPRRRHPRARP